MIYVTGDLHGNIDFDKINKIPTGCDKLIILGDFGVIFDQVETDSEKILLDKLQNTGVEILFIDGNHENFTRLNQFPTTKKYGDEVGVIRDGIYHLLRGNIYKIDGNSVFVMGGGLSVDKKYRTEQISWWKEEEPSYAEIERGFENLDKVNKTIDFIFTHSSPSKIKKYLSSSFIQNGFFDTKGSNDSYTEKLLDEMLDVKFKIWYFGHYHTNIMIEDDEFGKFIGLYENIIPLGYFDRLVG